LLQGVFGAALVPLSQSILLEINPRHRHGQAMAIFGVGVMVGPILGPTLGGWLTESYNWRWVFFINVPVGIVALLGTLAYLPETGRQHGRALDFFGFAMLSLTVGALQALLDRGEKLDWFASTEIRLEAIVAAIGFLFFVVHTATARGRSFLPAALLKDRNFITCSSFIFLIGAVMYATRALLPPMLQSLMNYPVMTTGLVTAPSGAGTMLAMLLAGRFVGRIDVRAMLIAGFAVSAWSLWQMMHYTTVLSESDIVWPGLIQGVGLGFVFVPLSSMAFSTLPSTVRADGTAFYSLMRNIGSSIGISVIEASAARNTQIAHASLAEHLSVFDPIVREQVDVHSLAALARLNELVTQQANMIAYVDAFKLMFVATLAVLPLALIIRTTKHHGSAGETHLVID